MHKRFEDFGWWLLLAAGLWMCACIAAPAQTQAFYANNILDSTGAKLANGQVTVQPTTGSPSSASQVISYRYPGGGQGTMQVVAGNVINGAFSLSLPDVAQTRPANVCFHVTVLDLSTNDTVLDDGCVQPSMTAAYASNWCGTAQNGCDFDLFIPPVPTIGPQNLDGSIAYNYAGTGSAGEIIIATYPGATLEAQRQAAEAANPGTATFLITQPGTIGSSTVPLAPGHHLIVQGVPVTINPYLIPTTDNSLDCIGDAQITMGVSYQTPTVPDGTTPFFYSPASGTELERFAVRNCTFQGYGSAGTVLDSDGPTRDVTLEGDTTNYAWLYRQNSAPASNPTLRLKIDGNKCIWPVNIGTGACVLSYGASQDFEMQRNYWSGYYGVEMYAAAADGTEAPSFPTPAQIQSSGLANGIISNNVCGPNITACQWTSVADRITMADNTADGCADVCFDVEGGAHHLFGINHCVHDVNGCVTSFFSSYANTADLTEVDDCSEMFHIFNASVSDVQVQDWTISNPVYNCPAGAIAFYLEASQRTTIKNGKITNGTVALPTFESAFSYENNDILWTVPVPTAASNGPSPAYGGAGLVLPDFQDGLLSTVSGNTIRTTVAQSVPCISIGISNPNGGQVASVEGNKCVADAGGSWSADLSLINSASNPSTLQTINVRNNGLSAGSISTGGNLVVTKFGNYVIPTGAPVN